LYFLSFVLSICLPFCWFLYFLLIFHTSSKFGIEGYNANKLPLGKISKSTISKGYEVLKRISEVIDRYDRTRLEELSGYVSG
jgi:hypothetical protein